MKRRVNFRTAERSNVMLVRADRNLSTVSAERLEARRLLSAEYVSVKVGGASSGNDLSVDASVSGDGRLVAFASRASDLVPGFVNNNSSGTDIFVRDRQTGVTTLVSHNNLSATAGANGRSELPQISADGRFIVFVSGATNLGAPGNQLSQIYVYELATDQTTLISGSPAGAAGTAQSYRPFISGTGRYVVFDSIAPNLGVPGGAIGSNIVYLRDRETNDLSIVSRRTDGSIISTNSDASISDDGRYVTFTTDVNGNVFGPVVVPEDTNGVDDVFVRDLQTSTTRLVSHTPTGAAGDALSGLSRISGDGSTIVFESNAKNLVAGDVNAFNDVFAYDVATQAVTRISSNTGGLAGDDLSQTATVSTNGRYVAFESRADDLLGSPNRFSEVFIRDRSDGSLVKVGAATDGSTISAGNSDPFLSGDGQFVVFESQATRLDPNTADANDTDQDVFTTPRIAPATPTPADLTLSGLGDPVGTYHAGDGLPTLTVNVSNGGETAAGAFAVTFALSTDATFDAGDTVLATTSIAGLAAGAVTAVGATASLPPTTSVGSYYLVARADAAGAVTEGSDANNDAGTTGASISTIAAPPISPLLPIALGRLPATALVAGQKLSKPISLTVKLSNTGSSLASGRATASVILSSSASGTPTDSVVGTIKKSVAIKGHKVGSFGSVTISVLPAGLNGTFYVLVKLTDATGGVRLVSAGTIVVAPPTIDLALVSVVPPSKVTKGAKLSATLTVAENGNVPFNKALPVALYLSSQPTLNASSISLGTVAARASILPNKRGTLRISIAVPKATAAGSYFLIAKLDPANVAGDSNANNNLLASVKVVIVG